MAVGLSAFFLVFEREKEEKKLEGNEVKEKREYERHIQDGQLQLDCELQSYCPVQAEGTVQGKRLYFRSRWDEWTFAIAETADVDPVDIDFPDQGFFREGQYGKPGGDEASWMDYDDAERIIRQCAQEYLASQGD